MHQWGPRLVLDVGIFIALPSELCHPADPDARSGLTIGFRNHPHNMEEKILKLLRRPDYTPLDLSGLARQLGLPTGEQQRLERSLARLERTGQIARIKQGNRYALPLDADLVPGRIRMNRQGVGFLQPDDPKNPPLRIPHDATDTAMHGDHVLVRRDVRPRAIGRKAPDEATGRVVRVLERARTQLVGTL